MKNTLMMLCFCSLVIWSCSGTGNAVKSDPDNSAARDTSAVEAVSYACPMDCEKGKTYDQPGKCPVCGMTLKEKK